MLARGTSGFTGADIENMVNQAAVKAASDGAKSVSMKYLEISRDKILMGNYFLNLIFIIIKYNLNFRPWKKVKDSWWGS